MERKSSGSPSEGETFNRGKKQPVPERERLFIAVDLPEEVYRVLLKHALELDLKDVRYSRPDQKHLTLRFLGEVRQEEKECLISRLDKIRLPVFHLKINGMNVFPGKKRPRVLWAGVNPSDGLNKLHEAVEAAVGACGFGTDSRPWHPHITLARLKGRDLPTREQLSASVPGKTALEFPVDRFYLYRSDLRRSGAVYTSLRTFALGETSRKEPES